MSTYRAEDLTCIDLVKRYEGLRLKQYRCPAGVPTIGYGNTNYPRLHPEVLTISSEFAEQLLIVDLQQTCNQLNNLFAKDNITLNINQYSACVSFVFNIGIGAFTTSRVYRNYIKLKNANLELFRKAWLQWSHVGTTVLQGLLNRRIDEFKLFTTPVEIRVPLPVVEDITPTRKITILGGIKSKLTSSGSWLKDKISAVFSKG